MPSFNYSVGWLALTLAGMIAVLVLMNFASIIWQGLAGITIFTTWAIRCSNILKPLRKRKFRISFVIITMLSIFLLATLQSSQITIFDGLMIGLQMNFCAAIMIVGFAVSGNELSRILAWYS